MAATPLTVSVSIADVEPVSTFIAKALRAEAWLRQLTPDELVALPEPAGMAMELLQRAADELAGEHLPTLAGMRERLRQEAEDERDHAAAPHSR